MFEEGKDLHLKKHNDQTERRHLQERKKAPNSILGSHSSDIFSTINEEDYQAKHAAEMKRRDKVRLTSQSSILCISLQL